MFTYSFPCNFESAKQCTCVVFG